MYHSADLCTQIAVQLKEMQWRMRSVCKQRFIKGKRVARTLPLIYHGKGEQGEGAGVRLGAKKRKIDGEVKRD